MISLPRSSGILLHPTSLPGDYGIGDLGDSALSLCRLAGSAGAVNLASAPARANQLR